MATENDESSSEDSRPDLDKAKFDLEKWRIEEDIKLRRDEVELKRKDLSKSRWSSPLLIAVIGLFTSICLSVIQNSCQSKETQKLEHQKFESALIQKALDSNSKEQAKDRFQSYLDLGLLTDEAIRAQIERYIKTPETIPLSNAPEEDIFQGTARSTAKLSIGTGLVEGFNDLRDLIDALPPDSAMISHDGAISKDANSGRVKEEQRNVRVKAFLYAAKTNLSNDYQLVIGRAQGLQPQMYMLMYVSGLPPVISPEVAKLKLARDAFKKFYDDNGISVPSQSYDFLDTPIPVEIEGSLYFDIVHATGVRPGPTSLKSHMNTSWQVRPITSITLKKA